MYDTWTWHRPDTWSRPRPGTDLALGPDPKLGGGEVEGEGGALVWEAGDVDGGLVEVEDFFDDGEAKAGTDVGGIFGGFGLVETLKDIGNVFVADTSAIVRDLNFHITLLLTHRHGDLATHWRVTKSVIQ